MSNYDPRLSHFDIDIKRGKNGELFVNDICKMMADGTGEIEVKTDHLFVETNRLFIEHECRGRDGLWRPSGLAVTKAKLWAIVLGRQNPDRMLPAIIIVETEWLRRAVAEARKHKGNLAECKYGENPTRGVCIYVNQIRITAPL